MTKYNKDSDTIYILSEDKHEMNMATFQLVVMGYNWKEACIEINEFLLEESIINPCLN